MHRRSFLRTLALVAASATLDPERLLWEPGKKTIFLPSPALQFDPNAFSLVAPPLAFDPSTFRDANAGISLRMIHEYTLRGDSYPAKIDVLYGFALVKPKVDEADSDSPVAENIQRATDAIAGHLDALSVAFFGRINNLA